MNSIEKKSPQTVGVFIRQFLMDSHLSTGLNTSKVFAAWDKASGAGKFTISKYYRNGKLYVTMSSSVISGQLFPQKKVLIEKINAILSDDELFIREDKFASYVNDIIFK